MTDPRDLPSLVRELKALRDCAPALETGDLMNGETLAWLTRAKAAILASAGADEARAYQLYIDDLTNPKLRHSKAVTLRGMIIRNIDRTERRLVFVNSQQELVRGAA